MTVGTKSVLFGAHFFLWHPFAVAIAWWKLYRWAPAFDGARWPAILDPRAWLVLCAADKLALSFTPWWLYLAGAILSGEIHEYMAEAERRGQAVGISTASRRKWYESMRSYCARWAYEHADGRPDTWTGDRRVGDLDTPGGKS